jgi:Zn finger protein HypA/HybF involved in hydrogenase expression
MSTEHQLACDQCDFAVTTVAQQRQADGRMVTRRYCAACGAAREWDVGAQTAPRGPLGVPFGPRHSQAARGARGLAGRLHGAGQPAAVNCPVCGNDTLLVPPAGQELRCPQCGVGRMREQEAR